MPEPATATPSIESLAADCAEAARELSTLSTDTKNRVLRRMADELEASADEILAANEQDVAGGREEGLSEALWTTEVGLIGALPLLAAHHVLTRLKARWLTHLERALALLLAAAATPGEQGQQAGPPPAPHREGGDEA